MHQQLGAPDSFSPVFGPPASGRKRKLWPQRDVCSPAGENRSCPLSGAVPRAGDPRPPEKQLQRAGEETERSRGKNTVFTDKRTVYKPLENSI
ncbi:Aminodeoxychorismate synthase component 1 [Dissostichus eleginoides]|uniref:Aminodeoxychorismate synthase component 1 n=1 Tax=Dissostichus eleginoides TaxID=100907 RepID=A0AAD9CRB8_DISEL|nr:Aminodeoxychorismate synthase component 1 [Dissostichus eleginoides]